MPHYILRRYNNFAPAFADYSALQASGLHPQFSNYHIAHLKSLNMIIYGGLIMRIDARERDHAIAILQACERGEMSLDFDKADELPHRRFGRWKRGTIFGLLSYLAVPLPMFFPKAKYVFIFFLVMSGLYWANGGDDIIETILFIGTLLAIPLMLLHAEYVALPRLRQNNKRR